MSHQHRFHVITGASGAGKPTLLAALRELGYATVPEAGRATLQEQLACDSGILPWTDRRRSWP
jgi:predicted ATPase